MRSFRVVVPACLTLLVVVSTASAANIIAMEMLLVATPTVDTDGTPDTLNSLPASLAKMNGNGRIGSSSFTVALTSGQTVYLELWVRDVGNPKSGVAAGFIDLAYDPSRLAAKSLHHGSIYTTFANGNIDAALGLVDEFGGGAMAGEPGKNSWALLGRVEFQCLAAGNAMLTPSRSDDEFARYAGAVAWEDIILPEPVTLTLLLGGTLCLPRRRRV